MCTIFGREYMLLPWLHLKVGLEYIKALMQNLNVPESGMRFSQVFACK